MSEIPVRAKLKLQNAHLARLADECGGVKKAAEAIGVCMATYSSWLNFRSMPRHRHLKTKRMKKVVRKLCKLAKTSVENIFPEMTKEERQTLATEHVRDTTYDTQRITGAVEVSHLTYESEPDLSALDRDTIDEALRTLSYREREVLKLRFGLDGGGSCTLEEVGHIFKVTRERIRMIEAKALRKLRLPGDRNLKLKAMVDEAIPGGRCQYCGKYFANIHARDSHVEAEHKDRWPR